MAVGFGHCITMQKNMNVSITLVYRALKWVFPKIMVPQNGWFIMEDPIKMDDLGVPLFLETPKYPEAFAKVV